jgi:hypothetical protein
MCVLRGLIRYHRPLALKLARLELFQDLCCSPGRRLFKKCFVKVISSLERCIEPNANQVLITFVYKTLERHHGKSG